MDKGLLNNGHPALVHVSFIDIGIGDSEIEFNVETNDDDNVDGGNTTIEIIGGSTSWIATATEKAKYDKLGLIKINHSVSILVQRFIKGFQKRI